MTPRHPGDVRATAALFRRGFSEIRVNAKRRRLVATAIVVSSTVAVLALAAIFNALLSP